MAGVGTQHLAVALHGLRQLAPAVVEQALLEELGGGEGVGHGRVLSRDWQECQAWTLPWGEERAGSRYLLSSLALLAKGRGK